MKEINIPVVFITYIRIDTVKKTFEQIRKAKPRKFYYISDAGKNEEDKIKVGEVKRYVEEHVDWKCEFKRNYAHENMGVKKRIQSGLDWVFENEESAIIIEDDVFVSLSFFEFAQEMLFRYKDDERIAAVTSNKRAPKDCYEYSYSFSRFSSIWGWATWKRAWCSHDKDASNWKEVKKEKLLRKEYSLQIALMIEREVEAVISQENDTWDTQWFLSRAVSKSLEIQPNVELSINIGNNFHNASHKPIIYVHDGLEEIEFPLKHPPTVEVNCKIDEYLNSRYPISFIEKVIRLIVPASWLRGGRHLLEKIRTVFIR